MNKTVIALVMAFGLFASADAQNIETNDINRAMLEELRQMRTSLERIADEMTQLRKNESEKKARVGDLADWDSFQRRGPDIRQLAEIKLPDHANKDQINKYILDIAAASQGQNVWSDRDPQVAMLTKVGNNNIQLLIDTLTLTGDMNNYHIIRAIEILADEKSKPLILDALPIYHELVRVIIQRGWESDAKNILLTELKNSGQYLPIEWITAVANLNDSNSYPLLRDYFIKGQNKYQTFKAIKGLPIENISEAVDEAWQKSKNGDDCNRQYMAMVALEYGHVDALSTLIDVLTSGEANNSWTSHEIRPAILRVVDFRGSNEDLAQWFRTNRDKLRFDPKTKKFVTDK